MKIRSNVRNAALVGAVAAVAATAWATNESGQSSYVPAYQVAEEPVIDPAPHPLAPAAEPVVIQESLAPNEVVITDRDTVVVPVIERRVAQPAITVEQRRLSEDERIQALVMDKLANNPRLSGKIGVESSGSVVRLSGYTRTVGQAWHAERDARSVIGVRYVRNEIRPRVGGSV
jgi:hyperosmotically inducible periplasmic protein